MKLLKRIFLFIFILFSLLLGVITFVAIKYEEQVLDFVQIELGNQLSRPIDVEAIEYDLFESFPNVSVSLNNVKTYSFENGDKPFLELQRIYLVFDLLSVITGELSVKKIILEEGQVNVIFDKKGNPNYNILKESKESSSSNSKFSIENFALNNVSVGYFDWKENQEYVVNFSEGDIKPISLKDSVVAEVLAISEIKPVKIGDFKTSKNIPLEGFLKITIKKGKIEYEFKGSLNENSSEFKGLIQEKNKKEFWDLEFKLKNHSLNSLLSVVSESVKYKGIKTLTGDISAKVSIKGEKANNQLPSLEIEYQLNNTSYQNDKHIFKGISARGIYLQPNLNKLGGAKLNVSSFLAKYEGIQINGSGILSDFKRPLIEAKIKSEFKLGQIYEKLLSEDFEILVGKASLDMNLRGRLVEIFADNNLQSLDEFKSEGTLVLHDLVAQPKDFDYPISILNGKLNFTGKNMMLEDFKGQLKSTTFKMDGQITNYLKTILAGNPLTFDADLEIDKMVLEDFVSGVKDSSAKSTEKYTFNLPKSISLRTQLKMGEFTFRKFRGNDLSGEMLLENQTLIFRDLKLKTCDGIAHLGGSINTKYPNKVVFKTKTILKEIDAKKAFSQFENFGQDVLLEHHVNGVISIETNLFIESDKALNIYENKIYNETKLTINNGELVKFEPLIELQDFLNKDLKLNFNLSHLKFHTLKNDIKIKNSIIYIPEMDIRSSDINLEMEGTHTFNQDIDYLVKIKHSEIFKAKHQNKIDAEFGITENKDKTATLPLRMRGNMDDPKFSYDIKHKRALVKETWKKERQQISKVLKEEFTSVFKPKDKKKNSQKALVKEDELEDLNKERLKVTQEIIWEEEEDEEEEK